MLSERMYTCIARCGTCWHELSRAEHIPQSNRVNIALCAPFVGSCPIHQTFTEYNWNVDLEWLIEMGEK